MNLVRYAVAVTAVSLVGVFAANVLAMIALNDGMSVGEAARSLLVLTVVVSVVAVPAIAAYGAIIAGLFAYIRRRAWWAGLIVGCLASGLFAVIASMMGGSVAYSGTSDWIDVILTFSVISWCSLVAAVLVPLGPRWPHSALRTPLSGRRDRATIVQSDSPGGGK